MVPERSCGECTVCCTALAVETGEARKLPGVTCQHCTGTGCAIYESRYPTCRTYFCGWRHLPELDDAWRPDRSGVLITALTENIPANFAKREGVGLLVVGGEAAIRRPGFAEFVAALIDDGVAAYIGIPGPVGHYPTRLLLNPILAATVKARDRGRLVDTLLNILASAKNHAFSRMAP